MARYTKAKPLTIAQQNYALRHDWAHLIVTMERNHNAVDCTLEIQPSEESRHYKVRILYREDDHVPRAWMISPEMETYDGEFPHHVYDHDKDEKGRPSLCVFCPGKDGWNPEKLLSRYYVPWIITWLHAYETWLITGEWVYDEA